MDPSDAVEDPLDEDEETAEEPIDDPDTRVTRGVETQQDEYADANGQTEGGDGQESDVGQSEDGGDRASEYEGSDAGGISVVIERDLIKKVFFTHIHSTFHIPQQSTFHIPHSTVPHSTHSTHYSLHSLHALPTLTTQPCSTLRTLFTPTLQQLPLILLSTLTLII